LIASNHTESIQHEYKLHVSENQRGQLDGNGISLSILKLPQDSAKDSINQESIRNDKVSYSKRVPIDLDGTTQYTCQDTTKAVQTDEAKIITNSSKPEDKSRPCECKRQGIFIHCKDKDECHVVRSREPTCRRHGQDGFEILEKGWHEHGNQGSRILKATCTNYKPKQQSTCKPPTHANGRVHVPPMKRMNGRHPKPCKWNKQS
jgi:hypothetical protein